MLEQIGTGNLGALGRALREQSGLLLTVAATLAVFLLASRLLSSGSKGGSTSLSRTREALVRAFTTNWQLTLLASTALVLSLASGWTTWDGMRNFTGEPVLSLMVTFGIQGVMLIIAWLIGETFASGMAQRSRGRGERETKGVWGQVEPLVGMLVGGLCAIGLLTLFASWIGAFDDFRAASSGTRSWSVFADKALYLGVGLLLIATLLINQRNDIVQPYLQSARVMVKSAVLWVMFLSCMATSVFFSFDSLFSSIFPQSERKRAADIRAVRQVAGAVADIGALAQRRLAEEAEGLFRTPGWATFEKNLDALSRASQGAEQEIERYFVEQIEAHKSAVAAQQERIASAKGGQAGLIARKGVLTEELSRLKAERPGIAADMAAKKSERDARAATVDGKRVEMMAEEKGAEGTLKAGKGPVFRQRKAELDQMQDALKIQDQRVQDADKRVAEIDQRITQIGRELANVDADIAKLTGEVETAQQRINVSMAAKPGEGDGDSGKVDPARVRAAFERAHSEFRQAPTIEHLNALATQCTQLLGAMSATPTTKERVRAIDCDPKPAAEAAAHVFALNSGLVAFGQNCTGGDKLPVTAGTDAMLQYGRKCLQDSGLPSKDSNEMAARISSIDLNRDDKAHRFVVTWNAFADGNRLAYLALAIAIAIDGLVFMSGLFGANALRSPLTDIEDRGAMTADQLEATIDAALHDTAHPRLVLSTLLRSLHPINGHGDYTSELVLDEHDPLIGEMRQVLAMGVTIGAVRRLTDGRSHYLLHSGLVRYFAAALGKNWKVRAADVDRKELVNVIGVALLPDPQGNAEIVLGEMQPISDSEGYAAETYPFKIEDAGHRRLVMNAIGAGATIAGAVQRQNSEGRYFVSIDFYKTLLLMRAAAIPAFAPSAVEQRYRRQLGGPAASQSGAPVPSLTATSLPQLESPSHHDAAQASRSVSDRRAPQQPASGVSDGPRTSVPTPIGQPGSGAPPPVPPRSASTGSDQKAHVDGRGGARGESREREAAETGTNLGEQIRADIIHLGGLHAWTEREIDIARNLGAESEPEQALRRLAARAPKLATLVGQTIDENRASLRDAYDYLLAHHGAEAMYKQVLETVAAELDELMPLLMLTPGGPYQQILEHTLIAGLERQAGEGTLAPADDASLARARAQVAALKSLADGAVDRYARIVRIIDQYDERQAGSQVASFEAAKANHKRSAG